ncbi:hypothetical protein GOP47_0018814 [Adiantum capillus-veneris]|uniref:WRC domain-containing protein n=1 Tax=Adiantum capillus-veneris TaxID=13818 RepID=A0A9D4ZA01_ADICA|nr:hypothetical protein GOP47_0018814 [Adiantum capillus-veneris]
MRIRKRPATQCGAAVDAGRALNQDRNSDAQPADHNYKHPQLHTTSRIGNHSARNKSEARIDHGSGIQLAAPSRPFLRDLGSTTEASTLERLLPQGQDYDHKARLLLQDNLKWQQLQVQYNYEPGGSTHASSDAGFQSFDVKRNVVSTSRILNRQQLQPIAECDAGRIPIMATTRHNQRVLQNAGTCLPVAVAMEHHIGQVTQSIELHFQMAMDKKTSSSLALSKMDCNGTLKKQLSASIIRANMDAEASTEDTTSNEDTSMKFRTNLPQGIENFNEQEEFMKILTSDSKIAEDGQEDNMLQSALDWGTENLLSCGQRSGQGWQCKRKRAPDGGSIYCDYHQSKTTQHCAASWNTGTKTMKENKRASKQISSISQGQNMIDVKVIELPLFPSQQHMMYGNLQSADEFSSEGGAISERVSQTASYSKVHSNALDLKLALNSEALPSLVETDVPTQLSQAVRESPVSGNLDVKRRRVEGAATFETRMSAMREHVDLHPLTEVDIGCAGPEHLSAISVFDSALMNRQEINRAKSETGIVNGNKSISLDRDNLVHEQEQKRLPDAGTLEQELLAQNDDLLLHEQDPHGQYNLMVREQETNTITAHIIEANEQGQQHQCKRHDGRGWRCKRICTPAGNTYCENHAGGLKQRTHSAQIKAESKRNVELVQQRFPWGQQVNSCVADRTKSKLTGHNYIPQETPQEFCIKVHKAVSPKPKHELVELSQSELDKNIDDEMHDPSKQPHAWNNLQEHEMKHAAQKMRRRWPEWKLQEKKAAADKNKDQDRTKRLQSRSQRRCGRHDGRGWRCKSKCVPGSVYCEYHKEKLRRYLADSKQRQQQIKTASGNNVDVCSKKLEEQETADNCGRKEKNSVVVEHVKENQQKSKSKSTADSGDVSTKEAEESAVEEDDRLLHIDMRKEKQNSIVDEHVKPATSAPRKRKRRYLHDIYARSISSA